MKKTKPLLLFLSILFVLTSKGQLMGTKNIPGDYATLSDAINDLNTQGTGAGGVVLNLLAGNDQVAPAGGYSIIATGTAANPITLTGNGNTVTAFTPQATAALNDAIFKILGGDCITIQGFTLQENVSNAISTIASNNMTEWGIALLYASATDGAKNVTIQNNTISLNRTYLNTFGVYSSNLHTNVQVTTTADITAASGANDNLHIYSNNINNVNLGICVIGSLTGDYMATGLDIGGNSGSTANTITNYGTGTGFSAYGGTGNLNVNVQGIYSNNNININISYNSITSSAGGVTAGQIFGIRVEATGSIPITGSINTTINNNSLSLKSGVMATNGNINGILCNIGSTITTTTVNNNDFNNWGHTVAGTAPIFFMQTAAIAGVSLSISNNTFSNLSLNTTGNVTFISKGGTNNTANAIINVNNNTIVGTFSKTGSGGILTGYTSTGSSASSATETCSNNNFSNISVTGTTSVTLWNAIDGGSNGAFGTNKTVTNNTFTNITGGTGAITILAVSGSTNGTVSGNTIGGVTSTGNITGLSSPVNGTGVGSEDFFGNTINSLVSTGATAVVTGFSISTGTLQNIYKNKIYDLQSNNSTATGAVNGILISAGATVNVYNNIIGDLKSSAGNNADLIRGISITSTTALSQINISHNTVYLNASSGGVNFGSSGIFHTTNPITSTAALTLKNNIIVNTSTPAGTGITVAYRRSGSTLNNYASASNNNLFYAGAPGTTRLIFHDGTNSDQTQPAFQTRVSPREGNSVTELPTFLSTTGSSVIFLHIDASVATQIESGGVSISGITDDYDGNARNASFPDIGADEFTGITNEITGPSIIYTPLGNTTSTANRTILATITDPSGVASGGGVPLIYYRKGTGGAYFSAIATSISSSDYTFTIDYANVTGGSVAPGDIIQYYIAAQDDLGNLTTVPFGGSGATPPGSTAPGSPNRYGISLTYTWQGGTGDFQVAANWSPVRTIPDISDILVFDGSVTASTTVNNIPTQTVAKLVMQNNINVTLNAAIAGNTLTFDFGTGLNAFDIQAGSTVNAGTTTALNLSYGLTEGQLGMIAGTINLNGASGLVVSNGSGTNAATTVSGTLTMNGTSAVTGGVLTTLIFNTGATLNFAKGSGIIPTATYNLNSTLNVTGITSGSSLMWPSTIGGLTWNCPGQTGNFSLSGVVTSVNGSLTIQNTGTGTFLTGVNGTISIAGDATINGGTWRIAGNTTVIAGSFAQNAGTIIKVVTTLPNWSAGTINQTAGILTMSNMNGVFTLTATMGNASFAGTVDGGTGATGGMVLRFNGAGNQTLNATGATVSNKVGITVNKASGNCTLLSDFTANSGASVNLTSGKLTIAADKTLTITAGATVTGTNGSNYFVSDVSGPNIGKLRYSGLTTAAQNFAVGTATNYMPVTITPTTTGSSFAVGVFEGATQDGTVSGAAFSSPVLKNLVNATYQIDNTVVSTPASVTFGWAGGQEGSDFSTLSNGQIGIARYNGASYDAITGTGDNTANTATGTFSSFSPFVVGTTVPKAAIKVFLQGAYSPGTGFHRSVTAAWAAVLNANALNQPYSAAPFSYAGTESVSPGFFVSTGATTDITDWVLLELRDQTTPTIVIARRAAFVREDGVVVDLDGISNVVFGGVANGSYYLVVRHRNHLAIRTSVTIGVDGGLSAAAPSLYDLTSAQSQAFQDITILTNEAMTQNGGVYLLWGGNANSNTAVRASGPPALNDYTYLFTTILAGSTGPGIANIYSTADVNMDGTVRASGPPALNDYTFLFTTVLAGSTGPGYAQHQ